MENAGVYQKCVAILVMVRIKSSSLNALDIVKEACTNLLI